MSTAPPLLRALRPQQWVKNLFVLAALVFARGEHGGNVFAWGDDARRTLYALLAFCLGSSSIYLVNDVLDIEQDRQHPEKKLRPIPAGDGPARCSSPRSRWESRPMASRSRWPGSWAPT